MACASWDSSGAPAPSRPSSTTGRSIESELELGKVVPETQRRFQAIARRLVDEEGAQAVVLGCTELPLILNDALLPVPALDVMRIHIERLVALVVGE